MLHPPILCVGSQQGLPLDAKLSDLPLYRFQASMDCLGKEVIRLLEAYPQLPGLVLLDRDRGMSMISRQQFLEYLLRPQGSELFLNQPLRVLHSYARPLLLTLAADTPILNAAQQALQRPHDHQGEPIVVHMGNQNYCLLDSHTLNLAYSQLRQLETQAWYERVQTQMIRSDKMTSLGRLVDGVSHEILDPVSFIWGNLSHLSGYIRDLETLLAAYEAQVPQPPAALTTLREEIEIDYLREDIPRTLDSIKTGAERLSKLASSLQNFCHIDEIYPKSADIHGCLDSVLLLLKSRLGSELHIIKQYGHLPPIPCFIGQITQVFLNLITYAIDKLLTSAVTATMAHTLSVPQAGSPALMISGALAQPCLTLATETCSLDGSGVRWIMIRIGHNGEAMSLEEQQSLLASSTSPALLTQETSLLTSYRIIASKHRGLFRVRSQANPDDSLNAPNTTEFEIWIPLA
ncbi:MAG: hypothetical protein VKJ24_05080 [Synechococcales bacterium]|nr:hypothetical protein [Synechococcales bacterium]